MGKALIATGEPLADDEDAEEGRKHGATTRPNAPD